MKFIGRLIFSFIFIFLLSLLIFLAPLPFVFNSTKIKSTLHQVNLYDRITPIISENIVSSISGSNDDIGEIIQDNSDQLFSSDFITYLTENFIDELFAVINSDKHFSDIEIDISQFRDDFLLAVANSDNEDSQRLLNKLGSWIPSSVYLSDLFSIEPNVLDSMTDIIHRYILFFKILTIAIIVLFIVLLIFIFALIESKKAKSIILNSILFVGLLYFASFFFYRFYLLYPSVSQSMIARFPTTLSKTIFITLLSFTNSLTRIYSMIGLALISFSVLTKILIYWKREN